MNLEILPEHSWLRTRGILRPTIIKNIGFIWITHKIKLAPLRNLPSLPCLKQTTTCVTVASSCLQAQKNGIRARLYLSDLRFRSEECSSKELSKALDFPLSECLCFFFRNSSSLMFYNLKIWVEGQKAGGVERPAASDGSLGSFSPLCAVLFGARMPEHALTCAVLFVFFNSMDSL